MRIAKKAIAFLFPIVFMGAGKMWGQPYSLYSNDSLVIASEYLGETIRLNLHLPETQPFSAKTTQYPITIIFDSQHPRTYPQIIGGIDLLTSETQIPEAILIGVPFNFQNRRYFTSSQISEGDSLSGIERMELFLFSELIPRLQAQYKGNEFISLIGHSRTGYLVNYLAFKRPNQVNLALSLSGFFREKPLSVGSFQSFLTNPSNFPNKFHYYCTAGTTLEESNYLLQFRELDSLLQGQSLPDQVSFTFLESPFANHITNYWVSVSPILIDAFSEYNAVLDNWFHHKTKSENLDVSVEVFRSDLERAGNEIGLDANPNLTHIFSLASHFAYSEKDYETAIDFIELGLSYFPDYLDLYQELIGLYQELGNGEKTDHYKRILREKTKASSHLTEAEKSEIFEFLDSE